MPNSKEKLYQKINNKKKGIVIAIDGPAGAGKSTVAREVAKRLNFTYLDTGAMYRAVTLKVLKNNLNLKDEDSIVELTKTTKIDIRQAKDHSLKVLLDGRDITEEIRKPQITQNVSHIARIPKLRHIMVRLQRRFGRDNNIVVEGRDITTVVFPRAFKKFYIDADFKVRIKRRLKDFRNLRQDLTSQEVRRDLLLRDKADMTRGVGPLKKAADAIYIDSTNLSIDDVVNKIIKIVNPAARPKGGGILK